MTVTTRHPSPTPVASSAWCPRTAAHCPSRARVQRWGVANGGGGGASSAHSPLCSRALSRLVTNLARKNRSAEGGRDVFTTPGPSRRDWPFARARAGFAIDPFYAPTVNSPEHVPAASEDARRRSSACVWSAWSMGASARRIEARSCATRTGSGDSAGRLSRRPSPSASRASRACSRPPSRSSTATAMTTARSRAPRAYSARRPRLG
jgi:hypothetical protein